MINSEIVPGRRITARKFFALPLVASLLLALTGLVPANAASYPTGRAEVTMTANGNFDLVFERNQAQIVGTVVPTTTTSKRPTGTVNLLPEFGNTPIDTTSMDPNGAFPDVFILLAPYLNVGTHYFRAEYSGDANFAPKTIRFVVFVHTGPQTETVLTVSPEGTSAAGQAVTFTAWIFGSPGAMTFSPRGAVSFQVDGVEIANRPVGDGWKASFTTSDLGIGQHEIVVKYNDPEANFEPSLSFPPTTHTVLAGQAALKSTVPVPRQASDPRANTALEAVTASAAASYTHTVSYVLGTPSLPQDVAVDPTTDTVYVANTDANSVTVINGSSYAHLATLSVGQGPTSVAVDPGNRKIYVANYRSNTVSVVNANTYALLATVNVGKAPFALDVDTATHAVYVGNSLSGSVSVINGSSYAVSTIKLSGAAPEGVAVDSGTHKVYVGHLEGTSVTVIDGATRAVTAIKAGRRPDSVAVDPGTHTVYVANRDDNTVSVIGGNGATMATIPVGTHPGGLAVDAVTRAVFVANFSDSTLSVIDGKTLASKPITIPVGGGPISVAVSPATHTAYAANRTDDMMNVIVANEPAEPALAAVRTEFHSSLHGDIPMGQAVTAQAVIAPRIAGAPTPTGWVQFYDWNTKVGAPVQLVNGKASFKYTGLTLGKHVLNAKYLGSSSYAPRDTPARTVNVIR